MKITALILATILTALPGVCQAESGPITQKDTDEIVQKFQTAYADTFDRRDAKAMAAMLTENATMQNEWGDVTQGRKNIESLVTRLMAHLPAGTKLEDSVLVSQSVDANVIVSQGISHRIVPDTAPAQMFFTRVLVRDGDKWLMSATQIARPSTVPKPGPDPAAK